jgi:LysR family cyn operon transcriptional activator
MNFAHLRTFVAIADHGGFGRARLNLTQSAASRQIQGLEAELGVKLFDRIGRGVQLTSEGEDLLRRFRRVLAEVETVGRAGAPLLKGGETEYFGLAPRRR